MNHRGTLPAAGNVLMAVVETLGDALVAGWRITARCVWGKRDGINSRRECQYTRELDLETLVWTRGPNFPLSSLDGRLMCPRCRSRRVVVLFQRFSRRQYRTRLGVSCLAKESPAGNGGSGRG